MPCYFPLPAFYASTPNLSGKYSLIVLPRTEVNLDKYSFRVPCDKCYYCRLKKSAQMAIRCVHEASLHENTVQNPSGRGNCFITLTYNDEFLPKFGTLCHRDFQLFIKRLRKRFGSGIRFYMCGEYGSRNMRPHYHAILFNFNFDFDKYFWDRSSSGFDIFRSPSLERAWTDPVSGRSMGYSSVADFSFDSAAYVSRYVMKKIGGDMALSHYAVIDKDTGEVLFDRVPEYNVPSNRNGIGKDWFDNHYDEIYTGDFVVIKNRKYTVPKYYDRCLENVDIEKFLEVKDLRRSKVVVESEERLDVMRRVKERQVSRLVRNFDSNGDFNDS